MPRRTHRRHRSSSLSDTLRRPIVQVGLLVIVALLVYLIALTGNAKNNLPAVISVDEAYSMYQDGAFVLDVRTVEEWNDFHAPNTTLIPLDELASRVDEVPRDRPIVVVCRSGNRSQQGRDILLQAGFPRVTSMTGGLNEWRERGYPVEP